MPTPALLSAASALHDVFAMTRRVREDWNSGLSPENARLAHAVLGLCLRRWGRLKAWHLPKLKYPARGIPVETQIALNIGLAQLAWLPGVADYAAVAESVELLSHKRMGFKPHKGLVNALLRSASKDRGRLANELDSMPVELDQSLFAKRLLVAALQGQYSPENATALWGRLQQPASPAFVLLRGTVPDGLVRDSQFPSAWRLQSSAQFPRAWLSSGAGMVQDISSQALMAFCWPPGKKDPIHILDACAAPGGKTTALAHRWPLAQITALEQNPSRAEKLRENLAARQVSAKVEVAESTSWLKDGGHFFDLILVDAPCSASGTFRKHPELNWIFCDSDIPRLVQIQESILDAAISRLSPTGLLIYSVCSWFPQEGIGHLSRVLDRYPRLKPAPIWPTMPTGRDAALTHTFCPDPLTWDGEGFQGFALANCANSETVGDSL